MTCEESLRAWISSPPRKSTGAVLKARNLFWSFPGKDDMRGTPKKEELQNYHRTTWQICGYICGCVFGFGVSSRWISLGQTDIDGGDLMVSLRK